jgi:hypothetical protein
MFSVTSSHAVLRTPGKQLVLATMFSVTSSHGVLRTPGKQLVLATHFFGAK